MRVTISTIYDSVYFKLKVIDECYYLTVALIKKKCQHVCISQTKFKRYLVKTSVIMRLPTAALVIICSVSAADKSPSNVCKTYPDYYLHRKNPEKCWYAPTVLGDVVSNQLQQSPCCDSNKTFLFSALHNKRAWLSS